MVTLFTSASHVCGSLNNATRREWLVTDGLGGYAMGTVSGLRTRRYHGLLVVAGDVPARRMMALASLDPILTFPSGARIRLNTHEWSSGTLAPRGFELLESFELRDGVPRWRWRVGDVVIDRTIAMRHGAASVTVVHTLVAGGPITLEIEPLCTWRDVHGERYAWAGLDTQTTMDGFVVAGAYRVAGPGFTPDPQWYLGVHHREEAARGLNPTEDLLRPGSFVATLQPQQSLQISAWAGDQTTLATPPPPGRDIIELAYRRNASLQRGDSVESALRLAADAFIVSPGPDVVAGYPWFGAWSRDTMISYEGLFLSTGRTDEGRALLTTYAATLSEGMLANTADTGRVEHNTADATLWFLHAVDRHLRLTGDVDLATELVDALDTIVRHHVAGTRYGIRVDTDGLLTQGAEGYALTWMDAVVDGSPVTPRRGKAVELNALWINGLAGLAGIRRRVGRPTHDLDALHASATAAFTDRFHSGHGWLCDVVDPRSGAAPDDAPARCDDALRPNQLLAYALPYAPLRGADPGHLRALTHSLLTPMGPRSLAPDDPAYRGAHRGDPAGRDRAYHQGTVWPWLIGPYVDAAIATGLPTDGVLDGLIAHLDDFGIGSVSETADGDPPHQATGCPFQAWSVAELLRIRALLG